MFMNVNLNMKFDPTNFRAGGMLGSRIYLLHTRSGIRSLLEARFYPFFFAHFKGTHFNIQQRNDRISHRTAASWAAGSELMHAQSFVASRVMSCHVGLNATHMCEYVGQECLAVIWVPSHHRRRHHDVCSLSQPCNSGVRMITGVKRVNEQTMNTYVANYHFIVSHLSSSPTSNFGVGSVTLGSPTTTSGGGSHGNSWSW